MADQTVHNAYSTYVMRRLKDPKGNIYQLYDFRIPYAYSTANAGKVLAVAQNGQALEWKEIQSGSVSFSFGTGSESKTLIISND